MAFVDKARIFVKAGDGGKGCESFYRDRYSKHPRADGGDGGRGGHVIFISDSHIQTLLDFRYKQHYEAKKGGYGSSKGKTGRGGQDCILRVPVGTILWDHDTNLPIRDLNEPGIEVIVAKGGKAGIGNINRKHTIPPGLGEARTIRLELKLIADVGIVGFPNAGKSTFISSVSKVKSKIASYPFTTKAPVLGIVRGDDFDFKMADLPGLIEGAHSGRGLGHQFLKHTERTKILLHMVDMTGCDGRDPLDDYQKIIFELEQYSDLLSDKPRIIVANKMDTEEAQENLKRFKKEFNVEIFEISALEKQGFEPLLNRIRTVLCQEYSREKSNELSSSSDQA